MSSKRRTFHVDWDSPSHETGTVRRRPVSLSAAVSISSNCFENVEYYEVRDCIGGYGLRLLKSINGQYQLREDVSPGLLTGKRGTSEMEGGAVKDNGSDLKHPPSLATLRKKDTRGRDEDPGGCQDLSHGRGSSSEERSSSLVCDSKEEAFFTSHDSVLRGCANEASRAENTQHIDVHSGGIKRRGGSVEEKRRDNIETVSVESIDSSTQTMVDNDKDRLDGEPSQKGSRINSRKDFDLKLSSEPFVWKSKASRVTRTSGGLRKLDGIKSLIPKPKSRRRAGNGRGIVNSSSESSGIGSPLSPLSPLRDASGSVKGVSECSIRNSGSRSSGFASPESPLSPESQKYTAFYLIEVQLEKLRNCPCEKRQAEVSCWIK